jgi:YidC/Oxa1 family membrane protein insertase
MEDSKRLVLFIIFSVGILIGWSMLFPPPRPPKPQPLPTKTPISREFSPSTQPTSMHAVTQPSTLSAASQPTSMYVATQPSAKLTTPSDAVARSVQVTGASAISRPAEQQMSFTTSLYEVTVSNWGGAIVGMQMNNFRDPNKQTHTKLNLISRMMQRDPPYTERLLSPDLVDHKQIDYTTMDRPQPNVIRLQGRVAARSGGYVIAEKSYVFHTDKYQFDIQYNLINHTGKTITSQMAITARDYEDPKNLTSGGMFSMPEYIQVLCKLNQEKKPQHLDSKKLTKAVDGEIEDYGRETIKGQIGYAAIDRRYFLMAIVPKMDNQDFAISCAGAANKIGWIKAQVHNSGRSVAHNGSYQFNVLGYFGPKYYEQLQKVGNDLESSIDFGFFAFLSKPMLWIMQFFYNTFGKINFNNWGLSIILLTLLVKLLLWPLTHRMMLSMTKLKPQMDKLKAKYGDDKESLNREMMNLYVKEGVNPASSCLPMLVQMPIWIALYNTLYYAVELYQASFIPGWIDDLSSRDPWFILPIMLGVSMFIQQKMSPQTMDNAQAQMLLWFMPIFFTIIMLFLPAGLTLYIFVNTIIGVLHQWYIYNTPDKPEDPKKTKSKKPGWMERIRDSFDKHQEQIRRK